MSKPRIETFEEFWPFYLGEHALRATRLWHVVATTIAGTAFIGAIATQTWWLMPVALFVSYGMAWYSHFFIETNRPASFKYPFWSFIADWKMVGLFYAGALSREVDRVVPPKANSNA